MNHCKICNAKSQGEYCFKHKPKKPLKQCSLKRKKSNVDYSPQRDAMWGLFTTIWKKRKHVSEVSGEILLSPMSSMYFHHILLKSIVKEAMYDEENIILLTPTEHANVHTDMYRYPEINERRNYLKTKYEL